MAKLQLKTVNKELKAQGLDCQLFKGEGYYYFSGPDVEFASGTAVYVNRLNEMALFQWINQARDFADESDRNS
jgi:hypothetical protein